MTICQRMFAIIDADSTKSAAGLCKVLGVGTSQTTNWKSRNADPPAKYLAQICEYLGVSIQYLVTGDDMAGNALSDDEMKLLKRFRALDDEGREEVLHTALAELRRVNAERGEEIANVG